MTKIVFADVETTGTDPARHHLWELALIVREVKIDPATTADTWTDTEYLWQIRPDLTTADPMALKIGGFYRRCEIYDRPVGSALYLVDADTKLDDAMAATYVARQAAELLDGATLAAANVAFDRDFIAAFLRASGQALACDYHLLEMESYAAGALGWAPPWKLDRLLAHAGVEVKAEDRHSALGDARAIRDLYDAVRKLGAA